MYERSLTILERVLDGPARDEIRGLRPLVEGALDRPLSDEEKQADRGATGTGQSETSDRNT